MSVLSWLSEDFLSFLEKVYGGKEFGFVVTALLLLSAIGIACWQAYKNKAYLSAARDAEQALRQALGDSKDPAEQRLSFAQNYHEVDAVLRQSSGKPGAEALARAWGEFREGIIDETETPIRNTSRPAAFFHREAPHQHRLAFWSNVFVALGLILTFLGLVAALYTTSKGMSGEVVDVKRAQGALKDLVSVASTKFLTSIGGLAGSLILRMVEYNQSRRIHSVTERICALLEEGMFYASSQRLAAEQLKVMQDQWKELKTFNTDLAFQIADRLGASFGEVIMPVTNSLGQLNVSMEKMSQGLNSGVSEAIREASGGELRALAQTLGALSQQLDGMRSTIGASGDDAARQIRAAGADFAQAAETIREAFTQLTDKVGGIGDNITRQSEEAAQVQSDLLQKMMEGLADTQAQAQQTLHGAVAALQQAGSDVASTIGALTRDTIETSVAEGGKVLGEAISSASESIRSALTEMTTAVSSAATQVERAQLGFERSGEQAERSAQTFSSLSTQADDVSQKLGEAARSLGSAAMPVVEAVRLASDAAQKIEQVIRSGQEADTQTVSEFRELAATIRQAQAEAGNTFQSYQARFAQLDKELGDALQGFGQHMTGAFDEFRKFAVQFDAALGQAVSKLGASLGAIEDYAGSLDDFVEKQARLFREPAE